MTQPPKVLSRAQRTLVLILGVASLWSMTRFAQEWHLYWPIVLSQGVVAAVFLYTGVRGRIGAPWNRQA